MDDIKPHFKITKGCRLAYCSINCQFYKLVNGDNQPEINFCEILPNKRYVGHCERICEPWVMRFSDPDNTIKEVLSLGYTDRLIGRCASLLAENDQLYERRREAVQSHLVARTENQELKESLVRAVEVLEQYIDYCPYDSFGWVHQNGCDVECKKIGNIKERLMVCWARYLVEFGKSSYKKKIGMK